MNISSILTSTVLLAISALPTNTFDLLGYAADDAGDADDADDIS